MILTPALDTELDDIAALVNGAYRGAGAKAGWTHEADYIAGQRTDPAALRADLAANPQALMLIHRDAPDSPLLACVWLEPLDEPGVWYLGMLTVRPDLQDRKLGRDVLAAAEAYAAGQGAHRMRMTVVGIRDTLIAWYQRRGWRLTGETRPFPYDDQRFGVPRRADLDFVVLERAL
jgi:GNAT superfamily N-acetyltransferase